LECPKFNEVAEKNGTLIEKEEIDLVG